MNNRRKYRIHLRTHFALEAILILCSACLLSCALVVVGTVIFFHGEWTLPVVIILCLLVCSLTMVVGGIALYYGMAFFVMPIEEMNRVVNRIAKGDFTAQISRKQRDDKSAEYLHELDELEANVNRMASELAGMDYMRKDFVSNVSHEIKTPVSAMRGFAELLLEGGLSEEEQKEYIDLIYNEAKRISRLCENMLRMSRLENQSLVTRHEPVTVDEQIRKSVILLAEKWEGREYEFDLSLPPMQIVSDPDLLQQIWLNLIDNAMKYSSPGSAIHISGEQRAERIVVTVRDEGIGIPEEKQAHIFDAFYQCEESHKKDGNGLGLSIVKEFWSFWAAASSAKAAQAKARR